MAPDLAPEAWAQIRYDYERTDRPVEDICAEHGISSGTLRDRMRRWNWTRRRSAIPREGPPALPMSSVGGDHPPLEGEGTGGLRPPSLCERTPTRSVGYGASTPDLVRGKCEPGWGDFQARTDHPTPTVFAGAQTVDPPPPGEGVRDDRAAMPQPASAAPAEGDAAQIVPRLQSAVARVLPAVEATIAKLAAGPQRPRELEQTARALGALMRTLRELNALLSQRQTEQQAYEEDIDKFREEFARRIRMFIEARTKDRETTADAQAADSC